MKHLFIVNPAAGARDCTAAVMEQVNAVFARRTDDYEIYTTRAPMDAADKIRREADQVGALRVYACGGDGTLNECVCGAAGLDNVALTHFPKGTGNDFIKLFGDEASRFRDLDELVDGEVRQLDVIDCNGRKSLNICSVGLDARIAGDVHQYSSLPLVGGATAYVVSTLVHLVKGIRRPIRVNCCGQLYAGDMTLICCCNGGYYGGGFHPVPEARPDDGALDFLVIKGVSRPEALRIVSAYSKGRYADFPKYITHLRGDYLEAEAQQELTVNVDGEILHSRKVCFRLEPGALRFVVPRGLRYFAEQPAVEAALV